MRVLVNVVKFALAFVSGMFALLAMLFYMANVDQPKYALLAALACVLYFLWDGINARLVAWSYPDKK